MSENEAFLLQEIKELRYLVGVLLAHSGLDADGLVRAFDMAKTGAAQLDEQMMDLASKHSLSTPEGQQASQQVHAERLWREIEAWREDCREDGRIYPHPSNKP